MRYYEIVLVVHPDYNDQTTSIIDNCVAMVTKSQEGTVHRIENWGLRQLAYPIKKLYKAYYILLNIKTSQDVIKELSDFFRFNNIILRNMIVRTKYAITKPSPMMQKKEDTQECHTITATQ